MAAPRKTMPASPISILVKPLTGQSIPVTDISPSMTVLHLKQKLHEYEGIPVEQQQLIFKAKQLEDDRTLSEYGIGHDAAEIHLVVRLGCGGQCNGLAIPNNAEIRRSPQQADGLYATREALGLSFKRVWKEFRDQPLLIASRCTEGVVDDAGGGKIAPWGGLAGPATSAMLREIRERAELALAAMAPDDPSLIALESSDMMPSPGWQSSARKSGSMARLPFFFVPMYDQPGPFYLGYIRGPPGTPYEGGIFTLLIHLPREYPMKQYKAKMLTPIWHPSMQRLRGSGARVAGTLAETLFQPGSMDEQPLEATAYGAVLKGPKIGFSGCSYGNDGWSPTFTVSVLLMQVYHMLRHPRRQDRAMNCAGPPPEVVAQGGWPDDDNPPDKGPSVEELQRRRQWTRLYARRPIRDALEDVRAVVEEGRLLLLEAEGGGAGAGEGEEEGKGGQAAAAAGAAGGAAATSVLAAASATGGVGAGAAIAAIAAPRQKEEGDFFEDDDDDEDEDEHEDEHEPQ
eukprot:g4247.t1